MSFNELAGVGRGYYKWRDRAVSTNANLHSEQLFYIRFLTIYRRLDYILCPTEDILIAFLVYAAFALAATSIPKYYGAIKHLLRDNATQCNNVSFEELTRNYHEQKRVYDGIVRSYGVGRTRVQDAFPPALMVLVVHKAYLINDIKAIQFIAFFLLCIFAVRRLADVMAKTDASFETIRHVTIGDIYIDLFLIVRIKATKTRGLLQEPLMFPLARLPNDILCPVRAMELHIANLRRSGLATSDSPLFQRISNGAFTGLALGKDSASKEIGQRVEQALGRPAPEFRGRSCRVTGATMLMKAGVSDWLVRWIGDWKESLHWGVYVRTPLAQLLDITKKAGASLKSAISKQ